MTENKDIAVHQSDPFLQMVEKLAANPEIDADKVDRFLAMQERILDRQAKQEFYAALNRVQANLPTVVRDAANEQTRSMYARLETISKAVTPILTEEGFSTSFSEAESPKEGHIRIVGMLRHRDGYAEDHYFTDVPLDLTGIKGNVNKTATHATGSSTTYGRRYLKCMMVDITIGDDNDGNRPMIPDPITEEQEANLECLMDEVGADPEAFLKWANVESLRAIPARDYNRCVKALERKRAAS